jgi:hypothetical protein
MPTHGKCFTYESEEKNGVEPCKRISSSKSDEKKKKQRPVIPEDVPCDVMQKSQ